MNEKGKRFFELLARVERENLEGKRIAVLLYSLAKSNYSVTKNYSELLSALKKPENDLAVWDIKNRATFKQILWELTRLLNNYLSSTYSLIEHYTTFCNELKWSELNEAYSEEKNLLLNNDCIKFVKDLRTFSQQMVLPLFVSQLSANKEGIKMRILLEKDKLMKWSKISSSSKRYIHLKKEIQLRIVLEEYQFLNSNFYDWFVKTVSKLYNRRLKELSEVESEIAKYSS